MIAEPELTWEPLLFNRFSIVWNFVHYVHEVGSRLFMGVFCSSCGCPRLDLSCAQTEAQRSSVVPGHLALIQQEQHLKHFQESGLDSGGLLTCLQTRLSENLEGFLVENKYGRGSAA